VIRSLGLGSFFHFNEKGITFSFGDQASAGVGLHVSYSSDTQGDEAQGCFKFSTVHLVSLLRFIVISVELLFKPTGLVEISTARRSTVSEPKIRIERAGCQQYTRLIELLKIWASWAFLNSTFVDC
jgi:hypothetical protein